MKATLTSKGQITLPAAIRRKLNLRAGDVLEFDEDAPFLKAHKPFDVATMRSAIGRGRKRRGGKNSAAWIETLRGPVELP
jgi:AbrB family looped-hinge helix DNA binding protein